MDDGAEERMTKKLCSSGKMRQKEKYKYFDKNEKRKKKKRERESCFVCVLMHLVKWKLKVAPISST